MRGVRLTSPAPIALLFVAASVAACSAAAQPVWTFQPAPSPTPAASESAGVGAPASAPVSAPASAAASAPVPAPASESPSASAGGSEPAAGQVIKVAAQNIQFDQSTLTAPANQAFTIEFTNNDSGVPHNVSIKDAMGMEAFKGDIFNGVDTKQYQVPALKAGSYTFYCVVHPNMTGTLTVQ